MPHPEPSVLGVSHPLDGLLSLRPCGHARSAAAHGVHSSFGPFGRLGRRHLAVPTALSRPWCSTTSNSEEDEVESSTASKALEPVRPGSTAVVPGPGTPLRSTCFPDRHKGFRPRFPLTRLSPPRLGEPYRFEPAPQGVSPVQEPADLRRDPQLPWGSCCIRKTFWRLPMLDSIRHRHARRSWKFSGVFAPSRRPVTVARS